MTLNPAISQTDLELLGKLVNSFSVLGSQLLVQNRPDFFRQARGTLLELKTGHEGFLKKLDQITRGQNDESPLRLIEDLEKPPVDAWQCLLMVRRCLLVTVFLGHYIATASQQPQPVDAEGIAPAKSMVH